jgi:hypothetical protein
VEQPQHRSVYGYMKLILERGARAGPPPASLSESKPAGIDKSILGPFHFRVWVSNPQPLNLWSNQSKFSDQLNQAIKGDVRPCTPKAKTVYTLSALLVVGLENNSLSEAHKELLWWHFRLGHLGFMKIQFLMRSGVLATSQAMRRLHTSASKIHPPPK